MPSPRGLYSRRDNKRKKRACISLRSYQPDIMHTLFARSSSNTRETRTRQSREAFFLRTIFLTSTAGVTSYRRTTTATLFSGSILNSFVTSGQPSGLPCPLDSSFSILCHAISRRNAPPQAVFFLSFLFVSHSFFLFFEKDTLL